MNDEKLREAYQRETELFFGSVVRDDRSVLDLIDSDDTFLNERLARHYKIPGVEGTDTHVAFRTYSQHDLEAAFSIGLDA